MVTYAKGLSDKKPVQEKGVGCPSKEISEQTQLTVRLGINKASENPRMRLGVKDKKINSNAEEDKRTDLTEGWRRK